MSDVKRVERSTGGETRLSGQRTWRGCCCRLRRRAPPGVIQRWDAGQILGGNMEERRAVFPLCLLRFCSLLPTIYHKLGITKQNSFYLTLVSQHQQERPLPNDAQRGESSSDGGVSSESHACVCCCCSSTANSSKSLRLEEESCGEIQGPKQRYEMLFLFFRSKESTTRFGIGMTLG